MVIEDDAPIIESWRLYKNRSTHTFHHVERAVWGHSTCELNISFIYSSIPRIFSYSNRKLTSTQGFEQRNDSLVYVLLLTLLYIEEVGVNAGR